MVKADAYGHGAHWVAKELSKYKNLSGFGVATLEEGMKLRTELSVELFDKPIYIFSGATPWTQEKGLLCEAFQLIPILTRLEDLKNFISQNFHKKIPYEIKFNTGMNRLGIDLDQIQDTYDLIKNIKNTLFYPKAVLTHLASGEEPKSKLSQKQKIAFTHIRGVFESLDSKIEFHMGNSAALWKKSQWKLDQLTNRVRPGLALYGIRPWKKANPHRLKPLMELESEVINVLTLNKGDQVGYGGTYQSKKNDLKVAIISAGYADGIHRLLSQKGRVCISGQCTEMIGRVSMDLTAVRCSSKTKPGDYVQWFGKKLDLWKQAEIAQTIPYEILTSISGRVHRKYV